MTNILERELGIKAAARQRQARTLGALAEPRNKGPILKNEGRFRVVAR
jgi:hypothetical protein